MELAVQIFGIVIGIAWIVFFVGAVLGGMKKGKSADFHDKKDYFYN